MCPAVSGKGFPETTETTPLMGNEMEESDMFRLRAICAVLLLCPLMIATCAQAQSRQQLDCKRERVGAQESPWFGDWD